MEDIFNGGIASSPEAAPEASVAAPSPVVDSNAGVEGSPAPESSPSSPTDAVASADASIVDSATTVDPELAAKPGFQQLRSSYQQRVNELRETQARLAELESNQVDAYLKVDAPADDWAVGEQLDQLRDQLPPYYNKMAWTIMERHLPEVLPVFLDNAGQLPAELRPLVEASATAILQTYTGLEPEEIGAAIRQYKEAQYGGDYRRPGFQPTIAPNASASAPADVAQQAHQYGLDATNPAHLALLRELQQVKGTISQLTQGEEQRLAQTGESKVGEQLTTIKSNVFSKLDLPPGYEDEKADLVDKVERAFESDPAVIAAKQNLVKFYKQGTPDLKAAAGEITKLQTRLAFHYKTITEPRLERVKEYERFRQIATQNQQSQQHIPANAGQAAPPSGAVQKVEGPLTPERATELAVARWRANKAAKPF